MIVVAGESDWPDGCGQHCEHCISRDCQNIGFELWCIEVANIPYYNFLAPDEEVALRRRYTEYLENKRR